MSNEDMNSKEKGICDRQDDNAQITAIDRSPSDVDHLNYIEDMALELKEMAAQAGFETLSGILDMASREARLRKTG